MDNDCKEKLDRLCRLVEESQSYAIRDGKGTVKEYEYFVYPFKGTRIVDPQYHRFAVELLEKMVGEADLLLTVEADGIATTAMLADRLNLPYLVAKPFHYRQGCIEFHQETGYHARKMYIPQQVLGRKVAIVDCIVSTGGTAAEMARTLKEAGVDVVGAYFVVDKPQYGGKERLRQLGIECKTLLDVKVEDNPLFLEGRLAREKIVRCTPSEDILKAIDTR